MSEAEMQAESLAAPNAQQEIVEQQANETSEVKAEEVGAEQEAGSENESEKAEEKKSDWSQRRINELTRKRYEERARADYLEQQLKSIRESSQHSDDRPQLNNAADLEAIIEQRASQKAAMASFDKSCNAVAAKGDESFGKEGFNSTIKTLGMMGALYEDNAPTVLLQAIVASDDGHKLLHHLGSNPEETERIINLSPLQQARAIGALEARLSDSKPAKKAVSAAPPPIKPIGSKSSANTVTLETAATAEEFARIRNEQLRKKR